VRNLAALTMARRPSLTFKHGAGVGGITARALASRGQDPGGRYYWRLDEYLGNGKRTTMWTGWALPDEADRQAAALYADREGARAAREARQREEEARVAERGRTVRDLIERWLAALEAEAKETQDREIEVATADGGTVRLRPRLAGGQDSKRASRSIRSGATVISLGQTSRQIVRLIGDHPVADPDGAQAALEARFLAAAEEGGRRPSQVALDILVSRLFRAYRWGKANGLVTATPKVNGYSIDLRDPTAYCHEKWTPNREELAALLRAVDVVAGPRQRWARPLILLLAGTGIRAGEVVPILICDVDLERGALRLPRRKGGKSAEIALLPAICKELRVWIGDRSPDGLLFPPVCNMPTKDGRERSPEELRVARAAAISKRVATLLRRAAAEAGIEHRVTAHALRRHVSNALFDKMATGAYEDLMGHGSEIQAVSYRHGNIERQREALTEALGGLGAPGPDGGDGGGAAVASLDEARRKKVRAR
jgi:integrase